MMKVLLVNGSPHKKGCTYTALNEVAKTLNEEGIDTELEERSGLL
jgi:multimeric flavodoxin WrbA